MCTVHVWEDAIRQTLSLLHFVTGGPYELNLDGSAYHGVMFCTEFLMQAYHILAYLGKLQI